MLDKKHRLPRDINFSNAKAFSSYAFLIKVGIGRSEFPRFGIVVSKKIDKRAVGRNKIKRQIRSSIEKLLPKINSSRDILIIARDGIGEKSSDEILTLLTDFFEKFKLLK